MAARAVMLVLLFYVTLFTRKKYWLQGNDIYGTIFPETVHPLVEGSFMFPSLWVVQRQIWLKPRKGYLFMLLLLCGNVETCPGPPELSHLLKAKGIKIFHQNVRGLLGNLSKVKNLLESSRFIDILTLSETHLNCSTTFNDENNLYHSVPYPEFFWAYRF